MRIKIWDLFEDDNMFRVRGPDKNYNETQHLASIVAHIGPPPSDFISRAGERGLEFFDESGQSLLIPGNRRTR